MSGRPDIVFLCTANYYRSRFAELYFNHLAERQGLVVRADSAGLEMARWRSYNPGELSLHTVAALEDLEIALQEPFRAPRQFDPALAGEARLIALSRSEHQPMVARLFPEVLERTEFWQVEDVEFESPENAIRLIRTSVEGCIREYERAGG